jgi:sulfate adenylyltransferase large subunit
VDDGKSTLIGRLLYDSKGAYEDQMASITKAGKVDLALLTDGLRSEREQGITIDVAYRYFSTPKRKFIIADTPGHEQYTRNMATGASTADLAIILIDARNGVLPQSRRHAYIATLLGIRHLVVAVNKMDLMGFEQSVFEGIKKDFLAFARQIHAPEPYFLPMAALLGDNVVKGSENMPWFSGPHLLEYLESVQVAEEREHLPARFPVQYVIRPNLDYRGYAGQVASGVLRPGDTVLALPSGRTSRIKSIETYDGPVAEASAPMSVTVLIEDEIDIGRGDMLAPPHTAPQISRRMDATVVWMNGKGLDLGRTYLLKHTTQTVRATVNALHYRVNIGSLAHEAAATLNLNEIGSVNIETHRPLFFDRYPENRVTGAFILIDPATNETLAAGMISGRADLEEARHMELEFKAERVTPAERLARVGHPAAVVEAGSEALAYEVERDLFERGCYVAVVSSDGDVDALLAAGLIAIRVSADAPGSAEEILGGLEDRGVIRRRGQFSGGEGI